MTRFLPLLPLPLFGRGSRGDRAGGVDRVVGRRLAAVARWGSDLFVRGARPIM